MLNGVRRSVTIIDGENAKPCLTKRRKSWKTRSAGHGSIRGIDCLTEDDDDDDFEQWQVDLHATQRIHLSNIAAAATNAQAD